MQLQLTPEFGNRNVTYEATYVGTVCHSTIYSLSGSMNAWDRDTEPFILGQDDLTRIPKVSSDEDLFIVEDFCADENVCDCNYCFHV